MAFIYMHTLLSIYMLVVLTCTASLLSHDQECSALFEFKQTIAPFEFNQTIFPPNYAPFDARRFHKFESWRKITSNTSDNYTLSRSDCCLWDGVACSNKGHVIGLDLSGSFITGVINSTSTLFKLVHLQMLDLSMNFFVRSQIPPEIARLNQLRYLNLSGCGFYGQIPHEISHLIQLTSLDVSSNPLKLLIPNGLEYLLRNMTKLESLSLSGVDINSSVPRFLANFSSLRSIKLFSSNLQDEFPSSIFHLPKLKFLGIGGNYNLTGSLPEFHNNTLLEILSVSSTGFTGILPESISNLKHLEALDIGGCLFSGPLAGSLSNLTQLAYLSLFGNKFTGLVPSLANLSKLTSLLLGYNNLEIGHVCDWISKLTNINKLGLASMNIHAEILPCFANLTKLSQVTMRGNFIFGRIPSSFMNLTQLKYLDLSQNQLQGQISSSFLNFKSLEYLNIGYNNFSGMVGINSFLGLNKLEILSLDANSLSFVTTTNNTNATLPELTTLGLSSCKLKEFPAFLRFHMKMRVLILNNNEIEGPIPNWIWNNTQETLLVIGLRSNFITGFHQNLFFLPWNHLETFDMSYNQLQGRLPIPPQTILQYDVSKNNLTGEIPPMICELKFLQFLDLSSNKLTGTLPPCLDNLRNSLWVLDLKQNNFHGPMMNTCTHGSLLNQIDLSENRFSGQVSKSLAYCTNLEFLSLGDNSFEDVFPFWLGTLPKLQVLSLRSNKFYGGIQGLSTISSQFLKLRVLDISNNNFSGQLPHNSFQTWNAMKFVHVGESSSPQSQIAYDTISPFYFACSMTLTNKGVKIEYLKNLNIITVIDLSCNNFVGEIPQSLQDLHGLESLNLSNNHFTGSILPSLGNLIYLESLDLSQNKLSGKIPQQLLQLGFLAIFNVSFNHLDGRIPQGRQFNTFEKNSYLGNFGLCGEPLSKGCENSTVLMIIPSSSSNEYVSLIPSDRIDWMVILMGVGSGLVIGIVIGSFLYSRYGYWLFERLEMRKDKWVTPIRNTRRRN